MNFAVSEPMTLIFSIIAMLMALILAWRGYRSLARKDREQKAADKERDGR
jgi:hypothetical protein